MGKEQLYPRTILFDEKLLTQLNEYALRNGSLFENWLPEAIKEVLLPALKQKEIIGLENLVPGRDFEIPFRSESFSISNIDFPYPLGNFEFELESIKRTSRIDLRGNYNRLFPVVLCVRVVAMYTQIKPMPLKEYYSILRKHAYQVRFSLLEKMRFNYRQRGPYDGLPGHRMEEKIRTAAKEKSSWERFVRFFAEVSKRPGSGGLAQRLNFITINSEGDVVLTKQGRDLANQRNPILDDWNFDYDERVLNSTLSLGESEVILSQIKNTHPNEYEKMGELFHFMSHDSFRRADLLKGFYILNGMSDSKKSSELNGLMGRVIDLQLVDKQSALDAGEDGRSSTIYFLKSDSSMASRIDDMIEFGMREI
ncbi:MAG: hypothetical protein CMB20_003645 [Methanobacteriota archaeon]|nr:MAG: hypothetical protein CMB20_003645 [Euryarchaeota archaeon]